MSSADVDRWAWADIDHAALEHNVRLLRDAAGDAQLWAVVKADGYGHGAVEVARTALGAGAAGLCVALTQEALELRAAGLTAPILLLSQQPPGDAAAIVEHRIIPTVYETAAIDALAAQAAEASVVLDVHLKIDTGMQRVGAPPADVAGLVERIRDAPSLRLSGVFTHLAAADSDSDDHRTFTTEQLRRFDAARAGADLDDDTLVHAANSAATLARHDARRSIVRAGIAMYGISPGDGVDHLASGLRPVMSLRAKVSFVKRVAAGTGISYGLRHTFAHDTTVATVPIGYADGVPRRLGSLGGEVLVAGRRCPIVGVVTMDQLMVDVGGVVAAGGDVRQGDDIVLLGRAGGDEIRAEDWAATLDTIGYEIVCGVSARVPRRHHPATP